MVEAVKSVEGDKIGPQNRNNGSSILRPVINFAAKTVNSAEGNNTKPLSVASPSECVKFLVDIVILKYLFVFSHLLTQSTVHPCHKTKIAHI